MDILDDMGVSKLSAKVIFFKVNYSFKCRLHVPGVQINVLMSSVIIAQCFGRQKKLMQNIWNLMTL